MRILARRAESFAVLVLALLAPPVLRAEATVDVVAPTDVTYRESFAPEYGDECFEDADCGACQRCDYGYCRERYWGDCAEDYAPTCGSYHHCVTYEDACERRCEPNPEIPSDAVSCLADADCPSCHYCLLGYCEGSGEWRVQFCNLTIPESCSPGMHCAVNEACEGTMCVPDDPLPDPEADATASIPDDDLRNPDAERPRNGGCALTGGQGGGSTTLCWMLAAWAVALTRRARASKPPATPPDRSTPRSA